MISANKPDYELLEECKVAPYTVIHKAVNKFNQIREYNLMYVDKEFLPGYKQYMVCEQLNGRVYMYDFIVAYNNETGCIMLYKKNNNTLYSMDLYSVPYIMYKPKYK